jgi:hypothetical protein
MAAAAQEARVTQQLLEETLTCMTPAIAHEDNTGAMFLAKNQQVMDNEQNKFRFEHILSETYGVKDT